VSGSSVTTPVSTASTPIAWASSADLLADTSASCWPPAAAADPIDRASSAVQAVAIFYPVTDLIDLGTSTENLHDGGPPKTFVKAFGPTVTNLVAWTNIGRALSPLYHVHTSQPPVLIYHGTADTLTPPEQSERFQKRSRELGRTVEVVYHEGGKHGWPSMVLDIRNFADWFDLHLKPGPSTPASQ
jgi:acetyl esterase/lipase